MGGSCEMSHRRRGYHAGSRSQGVVAPCRGIMIGARDACYVTALELLTCHVPQTSVLSSVAPARVLTQMAGKRGARIV